MKKLLDIDRKHNKVNRVGGKAVKEEGLQSSKIRKVRSARATAPQRPPTTGSASTCS